MRCIINEFIRNNSPKESLSINVNGISLYFEFYEIDYICVDSIDLERIVNIKIFLKKDSEWYKSYIERLVLYLDSKINNCKEKVDIILASYEDLKRIENERNN